MHNMIHIGTVKAEKIMCIHIGGNIFFECCSYNGYILHVLSSN